MTSYPFKQSLCLASICLGLASLAQGQTLLSQYLLNGDANDTGSIGANGTLSGGATYVSDAPGNYSQSLDVTGSGSRYLEANVGSAYAGLTQITLTLWVNFQASGNTNDRLVSNLEASTLDGFDLRLANQTSPSNFTNSFNVNTTNDPAVSSSYSADNSWTFIAVTYDSTEGSNQVSYYTGDESTNVSFLNSASETGSLNESSLLRIGATPATNNDRTPPAYFSDVRVYNGLLDQTQLESVRNQAVVPEPGQYVLIVAVASLAVIGFHHRRRQR